LLFLLTPTGNEVTYWNPSWAQATSTALLPLKVKLWWQTVPHCPAWYISNRPS